MPENNSSRDPITPQSSPPASETEGQTTVIASVAEEGRPLSAIEAYRLDRERMFAERLKQMKDKEREKEAIKEASKLAAMPMPVTTVVASSSGEELPATMERAEEEIFGRTPDSLTFAPPSGHKTQKTLLSVLIVIGFPVLISIIYYGFIASDQYGAIAQFSIHTNAPPMTGGSGAPTGIESLISITSSSPSMMMVLGEMFVVQQYIQSPQVLTDIKPDLNIRELYARPEVDYLARLRKNATDQQLLAYWQSMVQIQVDNTTGLGVLTVRAFTPEDAKNIADSILKRSEDLVNAASDRSEKDTIALAQKQVDEVAAHVKKDHQALLDFTQQQDATGTDGAPSATDTLTKRDELQMQLSLDEQAYASDMTALQAARQVAASRGLYLEAFVKPQLADHSEYPTRVENVIFTFLLFSLIWVLGTLIVAATKEHL